MNNGNMNNNNKNNNNYVWPVRGGEWKHCAPDAPDASSLFRDLYKSYLRCRITKRGSINALRFEFRAEQNLLELAEELAEGRYIPSRSVRFAVPRPKLREIIAADFRDRVVHHYLVERLECIFEPVFIHDSYACRTGKGGHRAVSRVREFIRSGSANGRKQLFGLHLDVKNFFMSIDRRLLSEMVENRLVKEARHPHPIPPPPGEGTLKLLHPAGGGPEGGVNLSFLNQLSLTIIHHNPLERRIDKGDSRMLGRIPPHKSLLTAPYGKGLPIGNLTSQFFANVYLNELDQFCKHTLKCQYYVRYCDDFLILDESPEKLAILRERVREFMSQRLRLELNERYATIALVTKGIDFLGYIIRPEYLLVRRRAVNNLREKLAGFESRLESKTNPPNPPCQGGTKCSDPERGRGVLLAPTIYHYNYPVLNELRSVLASYLGHFKWANTNRLRRSLFVRYPFLNIYYCLDKRGEPHFTATFRIDHATFQGQCRFLAARFPVAAIFMQVGKGYVPVRDAKTTESGVLTVASHAYGMLRFDSYDKPVRTLRISPQAMLHKARRIVSDGQKVVIVRETGRRLGRLKERLPAEVMNNQVSNIHGGTC